MKLALDPFARGLFESERKEMTAVAPGLNPG